ncbi:acyl-CoA N-acyltransferase [Pisolithus thermaeus]|nr:acyl-CoA N-acyltransferase [Pisolithus thermaeus]
MHTIHVGQKRENADSDVEEISHLRARPRLDDDDDDIGSPGRGDALTPRIMSEEDELEVQHKQITARRNFDKVNFGQWQIKTWYFSPYPLTESELEEPPTAHRDHKPPSSPTSSSAMPSRPPKAIGRPPKISGVQRTTLRSHGRTSDLLAGGLTRSHLTGEQSVLWVCDRCFKYITEGPVWEIHVHMDDTQRAPPRFGYRQRKCDRRHPPGRKVYQRGAHTIWEVDGAIEKLYCQNLSLFGKFFIDVKTLFFDCDNFLFYILTDADSQRDHVLGFFSKEKYSYDNYNLACIVVLPPYQRKGYGMLMIEFSYELSRRAGKIGTPERPLSDLGLRSYLTYWVATIVRFLRHLLSVLPSDCAQVTTEGVAPILSQGRPLSELAAYDTQLALPSAEDVPRSMGISTHLKRKRAPKGFDGELPHAPISPSFHRHDPRGLTPATSTSATVPTFTPAPTPAQVPGAHDILASSRKIITTPNPDGSATSHVVVRCTLADIARATNLRVDDAAFALAECGLLERVQVAARRRGADGNGGASEEDKMDDGDEDGVEGQDHSGRVVIAITRERVEAVARERHVKEMCLSLAHVLP